MIRYPILEKDLIAQIKERNKTWLSRAKARTGTYVAAGKYTGGTEFWGQIKTVYIALQYEKCAYCETQLQGSVLASKVHEVEHYRPKSSIQAWPIHLNWATGAASATGYYKLAYHHFNYAIACTRCNSTLKSNFFPIRGHRDVQGSDPAQMGNELALLLYPISTVDVDDPQTIITFDGVLAVPAQQNGHAYERAVTNIEFFQLNHEDLTSRRALALIELWVALEALAADKTDVATRKVAQQLVTFKCSAQSEFTACNLAFRQLYQSDYNAAKQMALLLAQALPE